MSSGLAAFEQLWLRCQQRNAELRPRVAEWLRTLVPAQGPDPVVQVRATALPRDGAWHYQVTWVTQPRGFRRGPQFSAFHEFPIAPTVPERVSRTEAQLVGLTPTQRDDLSMAWLLEVLGEAWVESGLAGTPIALVIENTVFRRPGQRLPGKDRIRAAAYRTTAPIPRSIRTLPVREVDLVAPPEPAALPATPPELAAACASGEPRAVRAWGDALAAAGDTRSADLLHWLDGFQGTIASRARASAARGPFWAFATATQCWWGAGEHGTEPGDTEEPAVRLAQLLAGWNVYHPAAEWLLRRLGVAGAKYRGAFFADGSRGQHFEVDLAAGGHLAPVSAAMGVTELHALSSAQRAGE